MRSITPPPHQHSSLPHHGRARSSRQNAQPAHQRRLPQRARPDRGLNERRYALAVPLPAHTPPGGRRAASRSRPAPILLLYCSRSCAAPALQRSAASDSAPAAMTRGAHHTGSAACIRHSKMSRQPAGKRVRRRRQRTGALTFRAPPPPQQQER